MPVPVTLGMLPAMPITALKPKPSTRSFNCFSEVVSSSEAAIKLTIVLPAYSESSETL